MRLVICDDMSIAEKSAAAFEGVNHGKAFGDILGVFKNADRVIVNRVYAITENKNEI